MGQQKYIVVWGEDLISLTLTVNKKMDEGYIPQGGVSVAMNSIFVGYFQAMVLKEAMILKECLDDS